MDTTYRKNLKAVLTASKNYTDKTKEEIYWHIGDYSISTQDDNTTASTKTVPTGATRVKIKKIYGLTEKFNPSVAYDDASTMTKTMPNIVYDFDVSKVEGASEVSENLCPTATYNGIMNNTIAKTIDLGNLPNGTYTISFNVLANADSRTFILYYYNNGVWDSVNNINTSLNGTGAKSYTFTLDNSIPYDDIRLGINTGSLNYSIELDSLMLNKGSTALPYEPYFANIHNLELSGLKVEGANVLNPDNTFTYSTYTDLAYFECVGGATYTLKSFGTYTGSFGIFKYDGNSWSSIEAHALNSGYTITAPSDAIRIGVNGVVSQSVMVVRGSTAPTSFVQYVAHTTKTIDLSTILYNGSPLFEGNSLKGVETAKDYITPYVAHKQLSFTEITSNSSYTWISGTYLYATLNVNGLFKQGGALLYTGNDNIVNAVYASNGNIMFTFATAYSSQQDLKNAMVGVQLIYELATPIEVSIDWSSTLRGIQGYSNGTITLQNTYNMDTANTITYNSIIKENCCAKIVQSRGGSVVKTINFPTQASDGWSAGSVNNVRDFTTNKRGTNVSKEDLGSLDYTYNASNYQIFASGTGTQAQLGFKAQSITLTKLYTYATTFSDFITTDKCVYLSTDGNLYARDSAYTDATIFKTANVGNPLYYELADASKTETSIDSVDNITEVQPNDVLSFYDNNDNLVTVPSDLTYRIEVERV